MFWFFDLLFPLASCLLHGGHYLFILCIYCFHFSSSSLVQTCTLYQQEYYHILLICQTQGFLLVSLLPRYPFKYSNLMQICKFVLKNYLSIRVKSMLWHRSLFLIRTSHLSLAFFFLAIS